MKQEELDELEWFRLHFARAAANASSPYVAREIARLVDAMAKVSGPSRQRQRAIEARDRALRRIRADRHGDVSIRTASNEISSAAQKYEKTRLEHDLECCRQPIGGVEKVAFDAAMAGLKKLPSARALERILSS